MSFEIKANFGNLESVESLNSDSTNPYLGSHPIDSSKNITSNNFRNVFMLSPIVPIIITSYNRHTHYSINYSRYMPLLLNYIFGKHLQDWKLSKMKRYSHIAHSSHRAFCSIV